MLRFYCFLINLYYLCTRNQNTSDMEKKITPLQLCNSLVDGSYPFAVITKETAENIYIILTHLELMDKTKVSEVIDEIDLILSDKDDSMPKTRDPWVIFFALTISSIISRDMEKQSLVKLSKQQANGKVTGKN